MFTKTFFFFVFATLAALAVDAQTVERLQQENPCSIRGLSVLDNQTAWASGSKGYVAVTHNGGKTWDWQQIKGFEQSDFRDIEAFSAREAIVMSSGTPALILKTVDGGVSWKAMFRSDDKNYFFDAMDFFNRRHGLIMGDPINGKFLLLETNNKGETWTILKNAPAALPDEAAFAASGTCLRAVKSRGNAMMVTGGSVSRFFLGKHLKKWSATPLPIAQGQTSKGAFSIAFGKGYTVITGGNYQQNKNTDSIACYNDGKSKTPKFQLAQRMPKGYQSCIAYLDKATFISTGTSGTNITTDGGKTWKQIDVSSYNVCQKAKRGTLVLLAGDQGRIAQFKM